MKIALLQILGLHGTENSALGIASAKSNRRQLSTRLSRLRGKIISRGRKLDTEAGHVDHNGRRSGGRYRHFTITESAPAIKKLKPPVQGKRQTLNDPDLVSLK
jgi:hypothetical protein